MIQHIDRSKEISHIHVSIDAKKASAHFDMYCFKKVVKVVQAEMSRIDP